MRSSLKALDHYHYQKYVTFFRFFNTPILLKNVIYSESNLMLRVHKQISYRGIISPFGNSPAPTINESLAGRASFFRAQLV